MRRRWHGEAAQQYKKIGMLVLTKAPGCRSPNGLGVGVLLRRQLMVSRRTNGALNLTGLIKALATRFMFRMRETSFFPLAGC